MTLSPVSDDTAQVHQLLEPGLPTLPPEASIHSAAALMQGLPHSCVWVVKSQACLGVLTEQEIFQAVASGQDLTQTPVSQFMLAHTETVAETEGILQAQQKLQRSRLPYLPVVNQHSELIGLVTRQSLDRAALTLQLPEHRALPRQPSAQAALPIPRRESYLATLVLVHQELVGLQQRNRLRIFNRVLQLLGLATNVSRVYLFENHVDAQGNQVSSKRAEWCNQGIKSEIDNPVLQNISYRDFAPRWYDLLSQGEPVVGSVTDMPPSEQELLEPQGIQSILILPIRTAKSSMALTFGQFYGFIGFDDCTQTRQWDVEEINLLKTVAASLSLAYEHQQVQQILNQTQTVFSSVFQCCPDPISIATFPEGRYLALNPSFEVLAGGVPRSQILGHTPVELGLIPNPRQVARLLRLLRQGGSLESQEMDYRQGVEGPIRTLLISCELIEFEGKTCVLAICKDITDRKQMENALRQSEARFRAIFEQAGVGICMADLSGVMIEANPGLCQLLNYTQAELAQKNFVEITHPEDVESDLAYHRRLLAGQIRSFSIEKRYLDRAGQVIWVNLTVCLVRDSEGNPLFSIGVSQDISDRKAAELALRQSQERYALATRESRVGVWDWDLTTDQIYISSNLKALLGYRNEDVTNQMERWRELLYAEDRAKVNAALQAHLEGRTTEVALSHRMLHRDGSIRWILTRGVAVRDSAGKPVRMAGTETDITDLKYAEDALMQSHRQVADILESITDAFVALDESWRFTYINQRAEQLLHQSREQLLSRVIWQEFPEIAQLSSFTQFHRAVEERISLTLEEYYPSFDAWYEVRIYPTPGGLAVYFHDISDRKRAYEQLQQQIRREQALNRVLQAIRQSLDLDTIFSTAAAEMFSLMQIDQVMFCRYQSEAACWQVIAEHQQSPNLPSVLGQVIPDQANPLSDRLKQLKVVQVSDTNLLEDTATQEMAQKLPGTWLLVPLHVLGDRLWGCMVLLRSQQQSQWQDSEIELLQIVANQLAIAIQQAHTLEQAQRELAERQRAEARLKQAQNISHTGNWEWDLTTHEITWSDEMFHIFGLTPADQAPGQSTICARVNPEDREALYQMVEAAIRTGVAYSLEFRLLYPDNTCRHVHLLGQSRQNENHQVVQLFGTLMDITQRKQIEAQLVYEALHDSLTGAPNRNYFMEQLNQAINLVELNPGYAFAVLFIDLDRFKVINDSLGHLVGDQLLIECTQRLQLIIRSDDLIARLGGDEFAVLLSAIENIQEALHVAERIHEVLRQPFELEGREIFISASVGVSSNLTGSLAAVDFLRDADTAMYRAKELGRGRSALFDPSMYEQVNLQLTLENDLRRALEREELELYYQPIFDLQSQQLIGFEALIRWHHPQWGCIGPSIFIPLAEETGLILPIGTWTIQMASQQLKCWHDQIPQAAGLVMGVNLSVKQFASANLIQDLDGILTNTGLDSSRLRLEITESALIDNPETAEAILGAIKARGVQLCIDDFGTGYSSLSVVHRFPVHILKIDRSFVSRMEEDSRGVAMVQAILALAQSLGMVAIAEGVETVDQMNLLQTLNCPYAQGYWFAKPLPAAEAEALILKTCKHDADSRPLSQ
ncbi:EAL domain-containing protein [Pseudanabaena sp. FACHB-2040]|uniref:EAL domain-containing protein n=1 Tax=Pseudanabaena sp. FACHB-2040 TaxID=2692859 RepID=UPI0016837C11|nr:EAL domain-containing protein [Pseudanabaena sp. FACHB-2040]MBD2257588.1 PAS domain S-box protein [Pseudanabaena sp. FACHB-2040]